MELTTQAQAVMLLTVSLGRTDAAGPKPLSDGEWARFAVWLKERGLAPAALLEDDPEALLGDWDDRKVTIPRIRSLLGRGAALALSLEKWQRVGLWILTRSSPDYPNRLKRRLGTSSPPVLFGCGSKALLDSGGIAVVGSRDASRDDLKTASGLGRKAATQGLSVVSGGARGVDQSAMLGALEREGTAVGVLANGLLRSATSSRYRKHLMANDLALVSPSNPEAGFNVGNAMRRNRYIYCLSDAAVVVSSTAEKGGTWSGAVENLEHAWVPLWASPSKADGSGNAELVKRGGRPLPDGLRSLSALSGPSDAVAPPPKENGRLPASRAQPPDGAPGTAPCDAKDAAQAPRQEDMEMDMYVPFLARAARLLSDASLNSKEIAEEMKLSKGQADAWLKRAVEEGELVKLKRPVRYQLPGKLLDQRAMK